MQGDEIGVAPRLPVEARERLDGRGLEAHVEDRLVGGDGAGGVGERTLLQLGLAEEELLLLGVALGVVDAELEDGEELGEGVSLGVELFERDHGAPVVGARVERLLVLGDGQLLVVELGARELADAEAHALLHVAVEDVVDDLLVERRDLLPLAGGRGQALDGVDPGLHVALAGGLLQALERVAEGAAGVAEGTFGGAQRGLEGVEALDGVVGGGHLDLQHLEEPLGVAVGLVERAQRLGGLAAGGGDVEEGLQRGAAAGALGVEEEGLPVGVERAGEVVLVQAAHVAEPGVEAQAALGLLGEREIDLQRVGEIGPALGLLVEGLEGGERRPLGAELVEDGPPGGDGLGDVADLVGEGLGGLGEGAAPLVAGGLGLLALAQHADQLAVLAGVVVEPLQRAERHGVGLVVGEARAPGGDRLLRVLEDGLVEAADALVELAAARRILLQAHLDAEGPGQVLVAAAGGVDAAERLRRGDDQAGVAGVDVDDALVDGLGAGLVGEEVLVDAGDLHEDVAAGRRRGGGVGGGGEDAGHLLVVGEAAADLHEALADRRVFGLQGRQLGEAGEGARVVAEPLVAEDADAAEQLAPLALGGGALAADLEDPDELADLVARLVDVLEDAGGAQAQGAHLEQALDELPGLGVALAAGEDVLQVADGLRRLVEPIEVDAPEGELDVERLVGRGHAEALLQEGGQILPPLLALVELLQGVEGGDVDRVRREDPLVVPDGLGRVAHDLFGDEGDLVEELDAIALVGRALGRLLVELFELAPALGRGEDLLQAVEGADVGRVDREDAIEVGHRPLGIAELLVVQAGGPLAELDLDAASHVSAARPAAVGDEVQPVGLGEVGGAAGAGRELGGAAPQLEVARELVEGAEDDLERGAGGAELLLLDVGELEVEAAAGFLVGLGLEAHADGRGLAAAVADLGVLLLEDAGGAHPRLGLVDEAGQEGDRLGVVGGGGERAHARREGVVGAAEALQVERGQLDLAAGAVLALREIAVAGDDLGRRLVLAGGDEEPRQRAHGLGAGGDLDHAPVERDGLGGVAEDLLFEGGPLFEDVGAGVALDLLAAQLEEPAQVVLALVGAEEGVERGHRLAVPGIGLDELAVGGHRLVELGELAGVDLGEAAAEAALLVGGEVRSLLQPGLDGLDEGPPRAGGARPRLEELEPLGVGGELVGAARVAERGRLVGERPAGHAGELAEDGDLLDLVVAGGEEDLVERGQARPLLLLLVDGDEGGGGARVLRGDREHALVRAGGALRGVEPVLEDARGAEGDVELDLRLGGLVGGAGEEVDQALPVALGGVELLEAVPVVGRDVRLAQHPERLGVARREGEDAAPGAGRGGRVLEALGVDGAQLLQGDEARRIVGRGVDAALQDLGDGGEVLLALGLLLQGVEDARGLGVELEDLLLEGDGGGALVEALGGELGHLGEQLDLGRAGGGRELPLVEREELRPAPALEVELLELGLGLLVGGVDLEQGLVGGDRVLHVGELLDPAAGRGAVERGLLLGVGGELGEALLVLEEVAPAAEGLVDAGELADGVHVAVVDLDELGEHRDERGVVLDLVAVDGGDVAEDGRAGRGLGGRGALQLLAEDLDEGVPALGLGVEAAERVARRLVLRVGAEQRLVLVDGLLSVLARLGEEGDLRGQAALLGAVGEGALGVAEDGGEARLVALCSVHSSRKKLSIPAWDGSARRTRSK